MLRKTLVLSLLGASFGLGLVQASELERAAVVQTDVQGKIVSQPLAAEPLIYDHEAPGPGPAALIPTRAPAETPLAPLVPDPLSAPPLSALSTAQLSGPDDPVSDREFLRQAAMSATLEVRACAKALELSDDPELRAYAVATLEERHAALEEITTLAQERGYGAASQAFDAWHAAQLTRFARSNALDEDLRWVVRDSREKALRYSEAYAEQGGDPELRAFARRDARHAAGGGAGL